MEDKILKELQRVYGLFRESGKFVSPELPINYTAEDVKKVDKNFTDYYHAMDEIRSIIGKLIDDIMDER